MNKEPIYHSNIFWHFCGRNKTEYEAFKVLCEILKKKCLHRNLNGNNYIPFEEPIINHEGSETLTWKLQNVCFADIPFAFLKHHIEMYGNVGLGFKKEFIIKQGGQPVIYVPFVEDNRENKSYPKSISSIIEKWGKEWNKIIQKYQINKEYKSLGWEIQMLRKYIKQFSFKDEDCAYYEREWRVLNHLEFEEKDVVVVIFPKRFSNEFINLYPNVSYAVSELILT